MTFGCFESFGSIRSIWFVFGDVWDIHFASCGIVRSRFFYFQGDEIKCMDFFLKVRVTFLYLQGSFMEQLIIISQVKKQLREFFKNSPEEISCISSGALEEINKQFYDYLKKIANRTKLDKSKTVQIRHC